MLAHWRITRSTSRSSARRVFTAAARTEPRPSEFASLPQRSPSFATATETPGLVETLKRLLRHG